VALKSTVLFSVVIEYSGISQSPGLITAFYLFFCFLPYDLEVGLNCSEIRKSKGRKALGLEKELVNIK